MKNEKAITLVSLIIYILVMLLVIGVIGSVSAMFYNNTNNFDDETKDIIEYDKFNSYFVKEIKTANNSIDQISDDGTYIIFTTGNSFLFKDNKIFYNDLEITKNVKNVNFKYYTDSNNKQDNTIVTVTVNFENYTKKMNYKIEEIY